MASRLGPFSLLPENGEDLEGIGFLSPLLLSFYDLNSKLRYAHKALESRHQIPVDDVT